jgi:hypothetical protein
MGSQCRKPLRHAPLVAGAADMAALLGIMLGPARRRGPANHLQPARA